jgi:hypothetical protein
MGTMLRERGWGSCFGRDWEFTGQNYALEDADKYDDADELMGLRHALTQLGRAVGDIPDA